MIKKWEYMIVKDPKEGDLNKLGDEGWELVSVIVDTYSPCYGRYQDSYDYEAIYSLAYLKREKKEYYIYEKRRFNGKS